MIILPIEIPTNSSKNEVQQKVIVELNRLGLPVSEMNTQKPWGIEFKIDEASTKQFFQLFFDIPSLPLEVQQSPFGPKLLFIERGTRLSWHVHERKDAYLRVLQGPIDVYASPTDTQVKPSEFTEGSLVHIPELMRHRLGSKNVWAVVAEISRNVFPDNPSNDADERRISDDFGRA